MVFLGLPLLVGAAPVFWFFVLAWIGALPGDASIPHQVHNRAGQPVHYFENGHHRSAGRLLERDEVVGDTWITGPRLARGQTVRVVEATDLQGQRLFCRAYTLARLEADGGAVIIEPGRIEC